MTEEFRKLVKFPSDALEKELHEIAVQDCGIDPGPAMAISRSMAKCIREISWGLLMDQNKAIGCMNKILSTATCGIRLMFPEFKMED